MCKQVSVSLPSRGGSHGERFDDSCGTARSASANYAKPEDLLGEEGLFKQLKKALIERALGAELTEHLGYEKGDPAGRGSGNNRNGVSSKTVLTDDGEIEIAVPRDRAGTFEPQLIPKGQTRFEGFDDKILSLYARGMTVREIQGHLTELYGIDVSPDLISRVTDSVLDEVREWQSRSPVCCVSVIPFTRWANPISCAPSILLR